jgi:HD-like signal output (HDOD) protein
VTRLLELTRDENYKQDDIVNLLSTDPGVASDVLRLANSPLFGVTRQVSSLMQASNLLGIKRIRTLVMGRCMVDKVNSSASGDVDITYYWRRSLSTGVLCARFADKVIPRLREDAFMGGLLSDVGIIVLSRAVPEKYAAAAKQFAPHQTGDFVELENKAVGVGHPTVSAMVLERWQLPEAMMLAVKHHHDTDLPDGLPEGVSELARVISGASAVARLLCESPEEDEIADACERAMNTVGLDLSVLQRVLGEIESDVAEFASILRIDVIPSRVYELIAQKVADRLQPQCS